MDGEDTGHVRLGGEVDDVRGADEVWGEKYTSLNLILLEYMDTFMQKCYNIMITGKVQDISFRAFIGDIARIYDLKGFAFNDLDGSVKMVCCGENGVIADFLEDLKTKGTQRSADIEDIAKKEIPFEIYRPQRFLRLYTDELTDIGRKLDKGNEILSQIMSGTSELPNIKNGIDNLNVKFDSYIGEQREHNQWMKEHNQRLEKILEKLAER